MNPEDRPARYNIIINNQPSPQHGMVRIHTAALSGLVVEPVEVECDIAPGLPGFTIVGLPDTAVQESRERIRAAIKNSGLEFPRTRVTVNLAPAHVRKEGPAYDLPIAIAVLQKSGAIIREIPDDVLFLGELALDGSVRGVLGALSVALHAGKLGGRTLYVAADNAAETSLAPNVRAYGARNLGELIRHLERQDLLRPTKPHIPAPREPQDAVDFATIQGQEHAKRALEIAAAGGHNILFTGPPGSGKTLLARALPSILPPLALAEALEVTQIWSVAGVLPPGVPLLWERPFRSPHHTASGIALVGGGASPKPGEASLAHRGVLFLDELPEFPRAGLENLRQPIEDGYVTIARAAGTLRFPAKFMLVASQNPCPCGYASEPGGRCTCSPASIMRYQKKLSGPLLDRIDLIVEVPRLDIQKLTASTSAEPSSAVRERVVAARARQQERYTALDIRTNAELSARRLREFCELDEASLALVRTAAASLRLSARGYHRLLRVGRTIADLAGEPVLRSVHLTEALLYRPRLDHQSSF